ncbi:MAG: 2,3-bisphosphoglycerate-independent phosphoglycerate mutase [Deltaproteobacteria bacterium]|nr:2,3-bisphosphoglycerate-independent phosphoglycerate mutase [Deltaproteobacteria bacterium]
MVTADRPRPIVLCVLAGFGERPERDGNAIAMAATPALDSLRAEWPTTTVRAAGTAVGLADGQPGNGEAGHLTLGSGRPVPSAAQRIDEAIAQNQLSMRPMLDQTVRICLYDGCALHLVGLLSDGGIHSHLEHLYALIDLASFQDIPVRLHGIVDGRHGSPRRAMDIVDRLLFHMENKDASLATLAGRYYAMDRDERWDRTYQAFHAMVRDKVLGAPAPRADTPFDAVSLAYSQGQDDEHLVPVRIGDYQGMPGDFLGDFASTHQVWEWTGEDCGLAFNVRGDRLRQLTAMLTGQGAPDEVKKDLLMDRDKPVRAFREQRFGTLTSYGDDLELPVVFDPEPVANTLAEVISKAGLTQLRCAESEALPHVTRFFNGGRDAPFAGEQRAIARSPRLIDHYVEKPAMSAAKVAERAVTAVSSAEADFILVTFANPDTLGHTGNLEAAREAVEAVDGAIGQLAEAVGDAGGALLITADHGNCETMVDPAGKPLLGHTANPVPLIYVNPQDRSARLRADGQLADLAPTLLDIMGLEQPDVMVGKTLRITS